MGTMNVYVVVLVTCLCSVSCYELEEESENGISRSENVPEEKKYYLGTSTKVSWNDAFGECLEQNMTLASITSQQQQDQLAVLIKEQKPYAGFWTSGTADSELYYWNSTGTPLKFTNWEENEPRPYKEFKCLLVNNGGTAKWMFYKCSEKEFYICEH